MGILGVDFRKPRSAGVFLTVDFAVVGAAVKEDTHGFLASIADRVAVDLDVVAPLRGDDAWSCVDAAMGETDKFHTWTAAQDGRTKEEVGCQEQRKRVRERVSMAFGTLPRQTCRCTEDASLL